MGSVAAAKVGEVVFAQLGEIVLRQKGVRQLQHAALARRLLEQVALAAHAADERHHDLFAQRIDGRVRHLGEVLLEVAKEQLRLVRQHREGNVDPHRCPPAPRRAAAIGPRMIFRSSSV